MTESPGDPSILAGGRLTIDLDALTANWRSIAARAAGAECGAAVKADAYGIGLEQAVWTLFDAGCRTFFVALPEEGLRARAAEPGARVFVLGGLLPGLAELYRAGGLIPVLNSVAEIREWARYCRDNGQRLPAALHVDTGMNRLGLTLEEARGVAAEPALAEAFELVLLISHMACAGDPSHPLNAAQLQRFQDAAELFPQVPRSLANSAATTLPGPYGFDLLRPGIGLYGAAAADDASDPLQVVVTAEARILALREVPAGDSVGYGASQTLARPTRLAILGVGYADGYPRLAGTGGSQGTASAWLAGHELPLIGRVSMDLIAVDVTELPQNLAQRGAWVELFGPNMPIDRVAGHAETIGYELLTGLGRRYKRRYLGGRTAPRGAATMSEHGQTH